MTSLVRELGTGSERLLATADGAVGWLTFNNPERRNAVSSEMWVALEAAVSALNAEPAVRVIILRGAGEAAFVSGADISQFDEQRASPEADARYSARTQSALMALRLSGKPTIAMIHGYCLGGGLGIAISCDLRIAADDAQFSIPAARLGVGYNYDGMAQLTALLGPAYALEMLMTARRYRAEEALRIGLVNSVTQKGQLQDIVEEYAHTIAANAPLTIAAAKAAVRATMQDPDQRDLAAVEAAVRACFGSADFSEGRRAFLEKRVPRFTGT